MDLENMIRMSDDQRKPFVEKRLSSSVILRVFNPRAEDHLFKWHKDESPRVIKVLNDNDWQFQYDDHIPMSMDQGKHIAVPGDFFHRVIPGTSSLWLLITEMPTKGFSL